MADLRIGVLGAASIVPSALLKPAEHVGGVAVTHIASRSASRAAAFAQRHAIPISFGSYDELLRRQDVDAVYIATPAAHHAHWIESAIAAGKHVLCEKPFTSNAQAARIVEAAAATRPDLVVMEAYHSAHHPFQDRLRAVLASGEIGNVVSARAVFAIPLISRKAIQWNAALGGGGLLDVGYYPVRQLRDLFGEPQEITAARAWEEHGVDRRFEASMRFANGIRGEVVSAIWSRQLLFSRLEITGDRGSLRATWPYHPQSGSRMTVQSGTKRRHERPKPRASYLYQLEAFRDAIADGAPCITGPSEAVAQLQTIDALYDAADMAPRPSVR